MDENVDDMEQQPKIEEPEQRKKENLEMKENEEKEQSKEEKEKEEKEEEGEEEEKMMMKKKEPQVLLQTEEKKDRINAIWERLNAKNTSPITKFVPKKLETKIDVVKKVGAKVGETKKTQSVPEWMVSLGFAHQKTTTTIKSSKDLTPKGESDQSKEDAKRIAATAIAAAKAASDASKIGKIEVNEVRDFAGEEVKITKYLDPNSKAAEDLKRKQEMMAFSSSGLDSLLKQIDKKPKLNVLEKSRKDWSEFKEEKQINEELESYKKSGGKYTDRVAFLQRSELREYEQERDARLARQAKKLDADVLYTED